MWRSHLDRLRFSNSGEPEPVRAGQRHRRRGAARPAGARGRQPPPEVRRPPPPGAPGGRRRVPRRHRPGARPAGRRRAPRRPAGRSRSPDQYGPTPAVARRPGRDPRPGGRATSRTCFRERWEDPAPPVAGCPVAGRPRRAARRGPTAQPAARRAAPDPPAAGTCSVQLLRTYPQRRPGYPFAPDGERSAARGVRQGAAPGPAPRLRRGPVPVVGRRGSRLRRRAAPRARAAPDRRRPPVPRPGRPARACRPVRLGHRQALQLVRAAGGDRVQVLDVENHAGDPVYVHAKVCVVDDVWATVGSDNLNRRSWTHDSELTAAVLDRAPGRAGAARSRRAWATVRAASLASCGCELWREHLDRDDDDAAARPARGGRGRALERRRPRRVARRRAVRPATARPAARARGRAPAALAARAGHSARTTRSSTPTGGPAG